MKPLPSLDHIGRAHLKLIRYIADGKAIRNPSQHTVAQIFAANPVVAMHKEKPTLMIRVGNGRVTMLTDAGAKANVLLSETTAQGKPFRRAQELRLERAYIPAFPLSWTLMHVLDERSPLHGYDAARTIAADARVFVTIEARDPMLATTDKRSATLRPKTYVSVCVMQTL